MGLVFNDIVYPAILAFAAGQAGDLSLISMALQCRAFDSDGFCGTLGRLRETYRAES